MLAVVDGHEPDARLDQPAGQEQALAVLVPAVSVAEPGVFAVEPEGAADGVGAEQAERLLGVGVAGRAVEAPEQPGAGAQARRVKLAGQVELVEPEGGGGGVGLDLERVVRRAEEARALARKLDDVVHRVRQRHERRQAAELRQRGAQGRAEAGGVVAVVPQQLQVPLERVAAAERRERRRVVVGHRVVHAADDRQPVGHAGRRGQVLADVEARHAGRDRPELPANLARGVGLHVPGVDVARAAVIEDQDARPDRRRAAARRPPSARATGPPRPRP